MRYGGEGRSRLLLIILIVTSLFLITLDLRGVKILDGVRSGTQNVLSPFQKAGSTVVSPFRNFLGDVTHLGRTRNEIEKLKADNARLRSKLLERKSADAQLSQLKSVLDLAGRASYKVLAARVISHGSSTSFTQTITIDAGTSSGVRQNMTVISGDGLVGVVKESYLNSALIMLATDPDFKVGVRIAGTQQIGILSGRGSKRAELQLLDNQKIVKVGDVLLARGSTNNRPFVPGIPVGVISAVDSSAGSIAQSATVMLYPNFSIHYFKFI
jgi:rod shape-determining protein MreC